MARVAVADIFQLFVPTGCGYEDVVQEFKQAEAVFVAPMGVWARRQFELYELPRRVREFGADLIFGLNGFGLANPPCPQALFPQDSHLFYPLRHFAGETLRAKLHKFYNRKRMARHLKDTSLLLCQTGVVEQRIRQTYGYEGEALICGSAVSPWLQESVSPEPPPAIAGCDAKFKLLCLSTYSHHKNFDAIITAFQHGRKELQDVAVFVTVDPSHHPQAGRFLDRVAAAGLEQQIISVGFIPQHQVGDYYAHVDAFLLPTRLETFCLPYVEAMNFGLPILTSDLDFAHAVCGDSAIFFDPWDARDIVRAIVLLREKPELRAMLAEQGRLRAAQFFRSWDDIATETMQRFRQVVAHTQAP